MQKRLNVLLSTVLALVMSISSLGPQTLAFAAESLAYADINSPFNDQNIAQDLGTAPQGAIPMGYVALGSAGFVGIEGTSLGDLDNLYAQTNEIEELEEPDETYEPYEPELELPQQPVLPIAQAQAYEESSTEGTTPIAPMAVQNVTVNSVANLRALLETRTYRPDLIVTNPLVVTLAPGTYALGGTTLNVNQHFNNVTIGGTGTMTTTTGSSAITIGAGANNFTLSTGLSRAGGNATSFVLVNTGATFTMNAGAFLQGGANRATNNTGGTGSGSVASPGVGSFARSGVRINNGGTFVMNGGEIRFFGQNGNADGGGVHVSGANARFYMHGGLIRDNVTTANAHSGGGAGVRVQQGATFNMTGGGIEGNRAAGDGEAQRRSGGGGVYVHGIGTTFTMSGGRIHDNHRIGWVSNYNGGGGSGTGAGGGGIMITMGASVILEGDAVVSNNASRRGGGIVIAGVSDDGGTGSSNHGATWSTHSYLTIRGNATISGNMATEGWVNASGGGIFVGAASTVRLQENARIMNNSTNGSVRTNSRNGGGVRVSAAGHFIMEGGTVSGNHLRNTAGTYRAAECNTGGGVAVRSMSSAAHLRAHFTMTGGTISGNSAARGGGIGVNANGEINITGGTIENNTAIRNEDSGSGFGGGIGTFGTTSAAVDQDLMRVTVGPDVVMLNNAIRQNNTAGPIQNIGNPGPPPAATPAAYRYFYNDNFFRDHGDYQGSGVGLPRVPRREIRPGTIGNIHTTGEEITHVFNNFDIIVPTRVIRFPTMNIETWIDGVRQNATLPNVSNNLSDPYNRADPISPIGAQTVYAIEPPHPIAGENLMFSHWQSVNAQGVSPGPAFTGNPVPPPVPGAPAGHFSNNPLQFVMGTASRTIRAHWVTIPREPNAITLASPTTNNVAQGAGDASGTAGMDSHRLNLEIRDQFFNTPQAGSTGGVIANPTAASNGQIVTTGWPMTLLPPHRNVPTLTWSVWRGNTEDTTGDIAVTMVNIGTAASPNYQPHVRVHHDTPVGNVTIRASISPAYGSAPLPVAGIVRTAEVSLTITNTPRVPTFISVDQDGRTIAASYNNTLDATVICQFGTNISSTAPIIWTSADPNRVSVTNAATGNNSTTTATVAFDAYVEDGVGTQNQVIITAASGNAQPPSPGADSATITITGTPRIAHSIHLGLEPSIRPNGQVLAGTTDHFVGTLANNHIYQSFDIGGANEIDHRRTFTTAFLTQFSTELITASMTPAARDAVRGSEEARLRAQESPFNLGVNWSIENVTAPAGGNGVGITVTALGVVTVPHTVTPGTTFDVRATVAGPLADGVAIGSVYTQRNLVVQETPRVVRTLTMDPSISGVTAANAIDFSMSQDSTRGVVLVATSQFNEDITAAGTPTGAFPSWPGLNVTWAPGTNANATINQALNGATNTITVPFTATVGSNVAITATTTQVAAGSPNMVSTASVTITPTARRISNISLGIEGAVRAHDNAPLQGTNDPFAANLVNNHIYQSYNIGGQGAVDNRRTLTTGYYTQFSDSSSPVSVRDTEQSILLGQTGADAPEVVWSITPSVTGVTITPDTGVVTVNYTVPPGTTVTVRATATQAITEGANIFGERNLIVQETPRYIADLTISSSTPAVGPGNPIGVTMPQFSTSTFTVVATSQFGENITAAGASGSAFPSWIAPSFAWASSNTNNATVTTATGSSMVVTVPFSASAAPGSNIATITATSNRGIGNSNIVATANIDVTEAPRTPTTVTITPNPQSMTQSSEYTFTADVRSEHNEVMTVNNAQAYLSLDSLVWSIVGVTPPHVSINAETGEVTVGHLANAGSFTIMATATNARGSANGTASVTILYVPRVPTSMYINLSPFTPQIGARTFFFMNAQNMIEQISAGHPLFADRIHSEIGPTTISQNTTRAFAVTIFDQFGEILPNGYNVGGNSFNVVWSISTSNIIPPTVIGNNTTGTVTVPHNATSVADAGYSNPYVAVSIVTGGSNLIHAQTPLLIELAPRHVETATTPAINTGVAGLGQNQLFEGTGTPGGHVAPPIIVNSFSQFSGEAINTNMYNYQVVYSVELASGAIGSGATIPTWQIVDPLTGELIDVTITINPTTGILSIPHGVPSGPARNIRVVARASNDNNGQGGVRDYAIASLPITIIPVPRVVTNIRIEEETRLADGPEVPAGSGNFPFPVYGWRDVELSPTNVLLSQATTRNLRAFLYSQFPGERMPMTVPYAGIQVAWENNGSTWVSMSASSSPIAPLATTGRNASDGAAYLTISAPFNAVVGYTRDIRATAIAPVGSVSVAPGGVSTTARIEITEAPRIPTYVRINPRVSAEAPRASATIAQTQTFQFSAQVLSQFGIEDGPMAGESVTWSLVDGPIPNLSINPQTGVVTSHTVNANGFMVPAEAVARQVRATLNSRPSHPPIAANGQPFNANNVLDIADLNIVPMPRYPHTVVVTPPQTGENGTRQGRTSDVFTARVYDQFGDFTTEHDHLITWTVPNSHANTTNFVSAAGTPFANGSTGSTSVRVAVEPNANIATIPVTATVNASITFPTTSVQIPSPQNRTANGNAPLEILPFPPRPYSIIIMPSNELQNPWTDEVVNGVHVNRPYFAPLSTVPSIPSHLQNAGLPRGTSSRLFVQVFDQFNRPMNMAITNATVPVITWESSRTWDAPVSSLNRHGYIHIDPSVNSVITITVSIPGDGIVVPSNQFVTGTLDVTPINAFTELLPPLLPGIGPEPEIELEEDFLEDEEETLDQEDDNIIELPELPNLPELPEDDLAAEGDDDQNITDLPTVDDEENDQDDSNIIELPPVDDDMVAEGEEETEDDRVSEDDQISEDDQVAEDIPAIEDEEQDQETSEQEEIAIDDDTQVAIEEEPEPDSPVIYEPSTEVDIIKEDEVEPEVVDEDEAA